MSLAVCTMLSNPLQWNSRYKNFHDFRRSLLKEDIQLYVAEVVLGNRPFRLDPARVKDPTASLDKTKYLELRTNSEIWHKENALNLLTHIVKEDAIAFIDADIFFTRPNWVNETLRQLEHYQVVQMFSHIQNLDSLYNPTRSPREGYYYQYKRDGKPVGGITFKLDSRISKDKLSDAPGGAIAFRKETLSRLGGLIDWCIMGAADFYIAAGLINGLTQDLMDEEDFTDDYDRMCTTWGDRATKVVNGNVGYVSGLAYHYWHGNQYTRKFIRHKKPLQEYLYTPSYDLIPNSQGLYELSDRSSALRDAIRSYLRSRDEDQLEQERIIA